MKQSRSPSAGPARAPVRHAARLGSEPDSSRSTREFIFLLIPRDVAPGFRFNVVPREARSMTTDRRQSPPVLVWRLGDQHRGPGEEAKVRRSDCRSGYPPIVKTWLWSAETMTSVSAGATWASAALRAASTATPSSSACAPRRRDDRGRCDRLRPSGKIRSGSGTGCR